MSELISTDTYKMLKKEFCIIPIPNKMSRHSILNPIIHFANENKLVEYALKDFDKSTDTSEKQAVHIRKVIADAWFEDGYTLVLSNQILLQEVSDKVIRRMDALKDFMNTLALI